MKTSTFQNEIFHYIKNEKGHLLIQATAGSGKTTTILECLKLIPRDSKTIFVSFSNTIVKELKERVPSHVKASTLHSLGLSILRSHFPKIKLESGKYFSLVLEELENIESHKDFQDRRPKKELFSQVLEILSIIDCVRLTSTPLEKDPIREVSLFYGLECTEENLSLALFFLEKRPSTSVIDFADMIYLPLKLKNLKLPKYDFIFYDEVQDANKTQLLLVEKLLKPTGRLISVGDPYQSIYGFSFSDITSMNYLREKTNTKVLPLSVCYRCAKSIVREAQKVNSEILPFEEKEEGLVKENGTIEEILEGDIVVSRNTKPLIILYLKLIKRGLSCRILGKDYKDHLKKVYKRVSNNGEIEYTGSLSSNLDKYLYDVVTYLESLNVEKPTENRKYLYEKEIVEILEILISLYPSNQILNKIEEMFSEDTKQCVRLMTIHKSKGLENNRVFFLQRFNKEKMIPSKFATEDWELQQENNLQFVAVTRAKKELILIDNIDE